MAADGLITIESRYGPEETMNRFEAEVRARGMTVFAHIDHAAGATAAGLGLDGADNTTVNAIAAALKAIASKATTLS